MTSDPVADVLNRAAERLETDGTVTLSTDADGTVEACNDRDPIFGLVPRAPFAEVVTALRQAAQTKGRSVSWRHWHHWIDIDDGVEYNGHRPPQRCKCGATRPWKREIQHGGVGTNPYVPNVKPSEVMSGAAQPKGDGMKRLETLHDEFVAACVARRVIADSLQATPRGLAGLQEQRAAQDVEDVAWRRYRRALLSAEAVAQ